MFDTGFAQLFRAVDRIRQQLQSADRGFRAYLIEELYCLQRLGEQYIDHWMTLEEQIGELLESYQEEFVQEPHSPTLSRTLQHDPQMAPPVEVPLANPYEWLWAEPATANFRKGLAYFDLRMFPEASESLMAAARQSASPLAYLYLAAAYAAQGHIEKARSALCPVLTGAKDDAVICAAREIEAQLLFQENRIHEACHVLRRILSISPWYADAWFNLALCHVHEGQMSEGIMCLQRAHVLEPNDLEIIHLLGRLLLWSGEIENARNTCDLALENHPRNAHLLILKAHIHRVSEQWNACIDTCQMVLRLTPESVEAWSLLAWGYLSSGRAGTAIATMKKFLSLCPASPEGRVQLGILTFLGDRTSEAENILLDCLPAYPNKSLVWIALGEISFQAGRSQQGHTRFLRAAKDTRKSVRRLALYYYGLSLLRQGEYPQAEKYLKASAVLGGANPAIWLALAEVCQRTGREHEAQHLYERAGVPGYHAKDVSQTLEPS